jgi:beta-glucosidase
MADSTFLRFPDQFVWGAAASAYQIEGAWNEDGRGVSIWDTFSHMPGKTHAGETGDVAADHYHRWAEDVRLMADLGLKAYRFSTAWPRILPNGTGEVNPAGLDFYDRLVDALLASGITPYVALYHYDLPQALQDQGGWPNRDIVNHFAEYAHVVAGRLGDRVTHWMTHNEPGVVALAGYYTGEHAPGVQDPFAALRAEHHLLLSHGLAVEAIRAAARRPPHIGLALNLAPVHPASDSDEDRLVAARYDGLLNRMVLDALLRGRYPDDMLALLGPLLPQISAGDLAQIAAPLDFLGVNYYSRIVVRHDPNVPILQATQVYPTGNEYSAMWEIYPPGIYELLTHIWNEYRPSLDLFVAENGICVPDGLDFDGRVRDERRIRYLRSHLAQVHRAMADGVPVSGYFVWSLTDNFEWAYGYSKRFGLVYVDFNTLTRTLKDSARWYAQVIQENGIKGWDRSKDES